MNEGNSGGLAINNDVIAQIAKMASLEVTGVAGMAAKPIDLKKILKKNNLKTRSVEIIKDSGALIINVYIKIEEGAKVRSVAEAVQSSVKEKVQNMTANAVARVNVFVSDIELSGSDDPDQESEPMA